MVFIYTSSFSLLTNSLNYFTYCDLCFTDCTKKLKNALFFVGEIGGNDYNYALFQGKTIEEVRNMVPEVVQIIKEAVQVCGLIHFF